MRISIEKARKTLATLIGTVQSTLGVLAFVFAYFLRVDFFGLRERLSVNTELLPLYALVLMVFGFFSIISGVFLLTEKEESP